MNDLYRRVCDPAAPHRNPANGGWCGVECFAAVTLNFERAVRVWNMMDKLDAEGPDISTADMIYAAVSAALGDLDNEH